VCIVYTLYINIYHIYIYNIHKNILKDLSISPGESSLPEILQMSLLALQPSALDLRAAAFAAALAVATEKVHQGVHPPLIRKDGGFGRGSTHGFLWGQRGGGFIYLTGLSRITHGHVYIYM
jgi:hypothetical protein